MPPNPTAKERQSYLLEETLKGVAPATPRCRHAALCGGCRYQAVDYAGQARAKQTVCGRLLAEALPGADLPPVELVASPRPYGYRQRMDFVFAFGKAGLRRRGRHREVVDLAECPLLGEPGFSCFRRARELAEEAGLDGYDYLRQTGTLRYFVVRRARAGSVLLVLVAKNDADATRDALRRVADGILAERRAVGVHWLVAPGAGDVSFGEVREVWGAEGIVEYLNGRAFGIGANTFFQANAWTAERAFGRLADWAARAGVRTAWDLYSGTGVIALHLADRLAADARVLAVENGGENLLRARANARLGDDGARARAGRVDWLAADAGAFLRRAALYADRRRRSGEAGPADDPAASAPDLVVVNPPRAGLGELEAGSLAALPAGRVAYLSCNPATLARDLARLAGVFRVESLTAFDQFPQTPHFETLALLRRAGAGA